jgi:hypothetical protein
LVLHDKKTVNITAIVPQYARFISPPAKESPVTGQVATPAPTPPIANSPQLAPDDATELATFLRKQAAGVRVRVEDVRVPQVDVVVRAGRVELTRRSASDTEAGPFLFVDDSRWPARKRISCRHGVE